MEELLYAIRIGFEIDEFLVPVDYFCDNLCRIPFYQRGKGIL
jgi:hypothetical protein